MSDPDFLEGALSPGAVEAAEWCLKLLEGDLDAEEEGRLRHWIHDSANRAALERALAAWELTRPDLMPAAAIDLRLDALAQLKESEQADRWPGSRIASVAAAALLAVLVAGFILLMPDRPDIYETGRGERRIVVLADGSRLSLDALTRVEVRFDEDRRALTLARGRARFDVRGDPLRPFSVRAHDRLVVATGTSFSVELLSEELRIILYEGQVSVLEEDARTGSRRDLLETRNAAGEQLDLSPGRELTVAIAGQERPRVARVDLARSASWEVGQLVFDEEPLARAVEILNRYSADTLVVGDAAAAAVEISGVFTTGDTASFVEGITGVFPLRAVRSGDRIVLLGTGSGRPARVSVPQTGG